MKQTKNLTFSATLVVLTVILTFVPAKASDTNGQSVGRFKCNEIILKLKPSATNSTGSSMNAPSTVSALNGLHKKFGVIKMEKVFSQNLKTSKQMSPLSEAGQPNNLDNIYKLTFTDKNLDVLKTVSEYKSDPNVAYAEPNYLRKIFVTPNDPYYAPQWGLKGISAENAWSTETGTSSVIIAIIDTGIDYNHEDLKNNIWTNKNELPDNGIDDDNNGFADDIYGWNFAQNNGNPLDVNSHGTHVAGIAGAIGNNSVGVAGVSWNCKLMPVKAFDDNGISYDGTLSAAIKYAVDNGAKVLNNSWGSVTNSQLLEDAINYAAANDVLVVCAAGNSNISDPVYPAAYQNSIAVAALDADGTKASFSNYGTWVDVAAPGTNIFSTLPNNNYGQYQGTSMACPFVSGLAGLLFSHFPEYTALQIRERIEQGAYNLSASDLSFGKQLGRGRIDAHNSLTQGSDVYQIKGYVKDRNGIGIGGVRLTLSGETMRYYTTGADGYFEFGQLLKNNYTLTATKTGHVFSPESITYGWLTSNQENQNFSDYKNLDVQIVDLATNKLDVEIQILPQTFSEPATLTVSEISPPVSIQPTIKTDEIGWELVTDRPAQIQKEMIFTIKNYTSLLAHKANIKLAIGHYDEASKQWIALPSSFSDNRIIAKITSLGKYTVLQLTPDTGVCKVIAYPNPYKAGTINNGGEEIFFSGLPQRAKIKIFTLTGELVLELDKNDFSDKCNWNLKNIAGNKVASGIYFFYITNPDDPSQFSKGKLAIIK